SASRSVALVTTLDTDSSAPMDWRSHSVPTSDTAGDDAFEKFSGVPEPVSESTSPTEKRLTAARAARYARSSASRGGPHAMGVVRTGPKRMEPSPPATYEAPYVLHAETPLTSPFANWMVISAPDGTRGRSADIDSALRCQTPPVRADGSVPPPDE